MKALVVSKLGPDFAGCALADLPDPVRAPGQVLIRMRAASLNFPDLLMTEGKYQLKPDLPFVPGMEVAGEVVDADRDSGFVPGEAVVAGTRLGGFAELVAIDASSVRRLPANLDFAAGASVGAAYNTAYVSLVRCAQLQPGEWVLVHGATGGVGLAAVDLAKALGARVIATSRSPEKLAAVAADYIVDATLPAAGFSRGGQGDHRRRCRCNCRPGRRRRVRREHPLHRVRRAAAGDRLHLGTDRERCDQYPADQGILGDRRARRRIWPPLPRQGPRKSGRDLGAGGGRPHPLARR
jgi:D-arabinose 1-dehydrogenase-like Zn-dependent alcohol dehydrogenase